MALNELFSVLGLPEAANDSDVIEGVLALKAKVNEEPDPSMYAPIAMVKELQRQLSEALQQQSGQAVEQTITAALSDGRLLPFQEEWARKLGERDIAQLREYIEQAAPIAALRGLQTGGREPAGVTGDRSRQLSGAELQAAKALGLKPGQYLSMLDDAENE